MNELEFTQSQENLENAEQLESVENQALQEATHDPGTRIEATQDYAQAEAVENALTEALNNTAQVSNMPIPLPQPAYGGPPKPPPPPPPDNAPETSGSMPIPLPRPTLDAESGRGRNAIQEEPDHGPNPLTNPGLSPDEVKFGADFGSQIGAYDEPGEPTPPPDHGSEVGGVLPVPIPLPMDGQGEGGQENRSDLPIPLFNPARAGEAGAGRGVDGIQEDPDHGPNPFSNPGQSPNDVNLEGRSGNQIADYDSPYEPPPPPDLGSKTSLTPDDVKQNLGPISGVDSNLVGHVPDPGGDPPGPNAEGGEDDNEATPINRP
jgi:hypothetical protein